MLPEVKTSLGKSVKEYLKRMKELEDEKRPWLVHYQALAEIFLTRKMDFTRLMIPGQFLQADVFDNTGQFCAHQAASVLLSMLWPDAERTFRIKPTRRLKDLPGVTKYFEFVTEEVREAMDNPRAGLTLALLEDMLDWIIFGTSGIGAFEGPEKDEDLAVRYDAWSIKTMCIDENANGFVDTIYYRRELTVDKVVKEYGLEKCSQYVKDEFANGRHDTKIRVVYAVEPKDFVDGVEGFAGMQYRSVHIDEDHAHLMRESGFQELPVFVSRQFKTLDEKYGRSSGMIALPDAQSLNALSEAVMVATEKRLDPPLGVLDDGRLGGGVVDTSAGALNVFKTSGHVNNEKPIFELFTIEEMQSADKLLARLEQKVSQAFFLDRLLDLNNKTMMTAYETSVRNRLRGESVGSVFARKNKETFTPLIERTFNILWRRGQLGVINKGIGYRLRQAWAKITGATPDVEVPDAVIQAARAGLEVFEIEYISPAQRFMQAEKLQGLFTAVDAVASLSPVFPETKDRIDPDKLVEDIYEYSGAPASSLRTMDDTKKIRAAIAARQQVADQLQAAESMAKTTQGVAQARAALGTAGGK